MLNNDLDLPRWRALLQGEGRIQIPGLLQASALERLRRCLTEDVPWTLALRDPTGQSRVIAQAELQRLGAAGNVVDTFLPRPNSLSLFKVPAWHCVSMVAPWALKPRLAITGWWQD